MVDFQAQRMMKHFYEHMEKYVQRDNNGNIFVPLG